MERIDHHVHLELPYEEINLLPYIERAKALNLSELRILEHSHRFEEFAGVYDELASEETLEGQWLKKKFKYSLKDYIALIERVKATDYGIDIKFGLEVCYFENKEALIKDVLSTYSFDFVIGSLHMVDGVAYDMYRDDLSRIDEQLIRRYFELEIKAIKSGLFDCIGHPDAIVMVMDNIVMDLDEYYGEICEAASEMNVALDVNAGLYYRYDVNHMGIDMQFLKIAKLCGVKLLPSSDAHKAEDLGKYLDITMRLCDPNTTCIEMNEHIYITEDFNTFDVYSKVLGKLVTTMTFKPHTTKGSVVMDVDCKLSDLLGFMKHMCEYYHVERIIASSEEDSSIYEELGMEVLYRKDSAVYYVYSH